VSSSIHQDSSYTVSRVPLGPATITVSTRMLRPPAKEGKMMLSPPPPPGPLPPGVELTPPGMNSAELEKRYVPIPEKYGDVQGSGLTYTVQSGKQEYNLDLK
jgi:hypothetical protein